MERLTIPDVRVDEHTTRRSVIDVAAVREHAMEIYWRMKAYEDTGREPEEVTALGKLFDYALEESKTLTEQLTLLKHIRELAEADKAGRCVVLPCKVGEKIYYLNGKYIIEVEVVGYKVDETGAWLFIGETYNPETNRAYHCDLETERIGKTVFFTSEDAKKTMEGMENGNKTSL